MKHTILLFFFLCGITFGADIYLPENHHNNKIYGLPNPTANDEAANKSYVDTQVGGGGGGGLSSVPIGKTIYVDITNGNDLTAISGFLTSPYKTVKPAVDSALSGDVIFLGPGNFTLSIPLVFPHDNITIYGAGANYTTLTGNHIVPRNGCVIADMTVDNRTGSNAGFSFVIGADTGDAPFTDVTIFGVKLIGNTDGFYFNRAGIDRVAVYDSVVFTTLECVYVANMAGTVSFYNCDLIADGSIGGASLAAGINQSSGITYFSNGTITSVNNATANTILNTTGSGTKAQLHNVQITRTDPGVSLVQAAGSLLGVDNVSRLDGSPVASSGTITQLSRNAQRDANLGDIVSLTAGAINLLGAPTKGKLVLGDGAIWNTLTVGTNTWVLTADSTQPTGVKWAAIQNNIPIGKTLYVDGTNGNDGTGIRGRLDKPFLTISAAISAASAGDYIYIGPGTFTITEIQPPSSVYLSGSGAGATTITSASNSTTHAVIAPSTNSVISNFTLTTTGTAAALGCRSADSVFTNAALIGVAVVSTGPSVKFDHSGGGSDWLMRQSTFNTTADAIVVAAADSLRFDDCIVETLAGGASPQARALVTTAAGADIRCYNSRFDCSGSTTGNRVAVATNGSIELRNGRILRGGGGTSFDFEQSGSGTISIENMTNSTGTPLVNSGTITQLSRSAQRDANLSDLVSADTAKINLWGTPTKGTVMVGNGTIWTTLPVGTDTQVLTADSTQSKGIKWAAGGGGGGGTPGSPDTSVQFASGGAFAGDANLLWESANKKLDIGTTGVPGQVGTQTPAAIATGQAGGDFTVKASDAVAGTSTAGGVAGGSLNLKAGDAKRLTSGAPAGGDVAVTLGQGIGGPNGTFSVTNPGGVNQLLRYNSSGLATGLGLTAPPTGFTAGDTGSSTPRGIMEWQSSTDTNGARIYTRKSRGTFSSPTTVVANDILGNLISTGYDGTNFLEGGAIRITSTGTVAATRVPTKMELMTATDAAPSVLTTWLAGDQAQNAQFAGKITSYGGAAPTNGQLLIGDTSAGNLQLGTITAGSGITITNGAHSITIDSSGGGGTPGGSDKQAQFNNGGAFGANGNLTVVSGQWKAVASNFLFDDITDPTKQLNFDVSNVSTGTTVTAIVPAGTSNPVLVKPDAGASNNVLTGIGSSGIITKSQQAAANLSDGTTGTGTIVLSISPALTGNPTAPTQSSSDNSTKIASTAYVTTGIANAVAAVNPAVAVQAATTAAGDTSGFTYNNGVSGIGATLTGPTVNTAVTIDGFTFTAVGQRLLVKNDTQSPSGAFNGVYFLSTLQTSLVKPVLTRALDYDMPSDINNTGTVPVINGTVNIDTSWLLTSNVTTVGTDPLTYTNFSINPANIINSIAGQNYLSQSGNVLTANAVNLSGGNVTGTLAAARFPALTGDVTTTAGSLATTVSTTIAQPPALNAYSALGGGVVAEPISITIANISTTFTPLDGQVFFVAVYLPVARTITGVKWYQSTAGNYTSDNNNKVGLYSYSGGTMTQVAASVDDGTIWKASTQTVGSKAFSSTYSAAAGLYFIAFLYNNSAQTTAPVIGAATALQNAAVDTFDFTNSAKLMGSINSQTDLPSTQASSGTTTTNARPYLALY